MTKKFNLNETRDLVTKIVEKAFYKMLCSLILLFKLSEYIQ